MKVTFKLTKEQAQHAKIVLGDYALIGRHKRQEYADVYNTDQSLTLDEEKLELKYVGQRYPFLLDGAFSVAMQVFHIGHPDPSALVMNRNVDIADKAVIHYETSDKRLRWHDTLHTYISGVAPIKDAVEWLVVNKDNFNYHQTKWMVSWRIPKVIKDNLGNQKEEVRGLLTTEELEVWELLTTHRRKPM